MKKRIKNSSKMKKYRIVFGLYNHILNDGYLLSAVMELSEIDLLNLTVQLRKIVSKTYRGKPYLVEIKSIEEVSP